MCSIQGWRPGQEDAHKLVARIPGHPKLSFFAVFDGHGGDGVSHAVAKKLIQVLAGELSAAPAATAEATSAPSGGGVKNESAAADGEGEGEGKAEPSGPNAVISKALASAIMKTDLDLRENHEAQFMTQGCTAIVSVVTPTHIVTANVGDSRAMLVNLDPSNPATITGVAALSQDQKPQNPKETERITAAGATVVQCHGVFRVNGDLAVARALGDYAFKNADLPQQQQAVTCAPEMNCVPRNKETPQLLLLACDGIFDVMTNDEVAKFVGSQLAEHKEIFTASARLLDECLERESRDNMSVILVDLNNSYDFGEVPEYVPPDSDEEGDAALQ